MFMNTLAMIVTENTAVRQKQRSVHGLENTRAKLDLEDGKHAVDHSHKIKMDSY